MVREERVENFYSQLRESVSASPSSRLLIFPSTSDVDSLCASKILMYILESDSVRYGCFPVSSFQEIHKYAAPELSSSSLDSPVSIVLINCGSQRDLRKILELGSGARVFVVDSHRPIHLHNLSEENDKVVVLYTRDDEEQTHLAYDFDVSALANSSDLNSDHDGAIGVISDDETDSDTDEDEGDGGRKRKRGESSGDDPVRLYKKLKREYYHMGTFHGKPSGCSMYELSHLLRKNTNELLWFACISLTDQYLHERLTKERYETGVMELEHHINISGILDTSTSLTLKDGTKIRAPGAFIISYEDEPRLMLLHEWNLFDSMVCSSYMATKLKTWTENGIKKLKLLLARMGFALVDCQQKFQYMNIRVKRKMKDEFDRLLPDYGLSDFYYRSFHRLDGYGLKMSAANVVYGITALLESFVNSDDSCASKQFVMALDALSSKNLDKLKIGMKKAIQIQKAILRQGSSAITKSGSIRSGRKFRWVKLEDSVDARLLGYPQALTKFGYFLMDALQEKGAKMKPLLCACLSQDINKMLIVGVCGKPRLGAAQGNAFGIAFRSAAEEIEAEYFHELFESSWIVLDSVSVNSFMIKLTEKL